MKSRASFLAFLVRRHKQGKGRRGIQHFTSSEVSALALRVSPFPLLQMLDRNDNSHVQTPTARTRQLAGILPRNRIGRIFFEDRHKGSASIAWLCAFRLSSRARRTLHSHDVAPVRKA
jgi:hypothetical protein